MEFSLPSSGPICNHCRTILLPSSNQPDQEPDIFANIERGPKNYQHLTGVRCHMHMWCWLHAAFLAWVCLLPSGEFNAASLCVCGLLFLCAGIAIYFSLLHSVFCSSLMSS